MKFKQILILFGFFCLTSIVVRSQDDTVMQEIKPKMRYKVWAEIYNGDTIASIWAPEVYVIGEYIYKTRKQYEAWTRTKYNVKKVYPYAIIAAAKLKEYDLVLSKLPTEKAKKNYMKVIEKELKHEFEDELKNLTVTQGKILLKLIDRETGKTSYEIVKQMRGGFQAFMWQSVARIFGSNMKSEYDPEGEDLMIERAIKLVEEGQF
jgi:hypothetical protein